MNDCPPAITASKFGQRSTRGEGKRWLAFDNLCTELAFRAVP